jgi:hypothetical protein
MAQLLINTKTHRVVTVQPDAHKWGRMESKQVWLQSGGLEQDWRGDFVVLKVPNRPYSALLNLAGKQFNIDMLTPDERTALEADGELAVQPWQLELLVS